MNDRDWTEWLKQVEAELEAASQRSEVNAAAKRLQRARAELKALEADPAKRSKRRASHGSRSADAS